MSLELLKLSMDIVEDGLTTTSNKNVKQKGQKHHAGSEVQGYSKLALKKKKSIVNNSNVNTKPLKQNVQEIRKELELNNNKTDENIKRLLALSKNQVDKDVANKIMKNVHKRHVEEVPKEEEPQDSIFTEEEFSDFARIYEHLRYKQL
ncbi:uncharacterized protein LOC119689991 [Teleopsis dalmanni]|uniref:uncharacterized protein LOC119689991 n=1 Tax=Teleopsis dalmanni TaxID=139649 RepID=UPI0018CE7216|nr:uncharacterized protein LOC119689991 [Teleopsis dalmanni]